MVFGIETEEEAATALHIANCIQGAIPEGSNRGQVIFAMVLLLAAGFKTCGPAGEIEREEFIADVIGTIEDVFEGRIEARFIKEH